MAKSRKRRQHNYTSNNNENLKLVCFTRCKRSNDLFQGNVGRWDDLTCPEVRVQVKLMNCLHSRFHLQSTDLNVLLYSFADLISKQSSLLNLIHLRLVLENFRTLVHLQKSTVYKQNCRNVFNEMPCVTVMHLQ